MTAATAHPWFKGTAPRHWITMGALLLGMALGTPALANPSATEPAEVKTHPPQVEVAGQKLQRHGAGVRYKAIFKVYSAALYLEKPVRNLEEIAHLSGPKRVTVTMLRTINASELGQLFAHGMEDNMDRQKFSKLVPGVVRMSDVFSRYKELKPGDSFTLDWVPQKGMTLSVNGTPDPAEFSEPEFYQAMLGIWLGPKPADARLKAALLNTAQ